MRRWQSGQMQRTVNPSSKGYAGSNPARRTEYDKTILEYWYMELSQTIKSSFIILCLVCSPFFVLISVAQSDIQEPPINEKTGLIVDCEFSDCNFNHFFELANIIVKVIIWIAGVGFFLVVLWSGTLIALNGLIFDGDFQNQVNKAKKMLRISIIGILLTLGAYLIVDFGFKALGYRYDEPFNFIEQTK